MAPYNAAHASPRDPLNIRLAHVLALLSALGSAAATIFIRQGLRHYGPYTGFWINLAVGTVGLWACVFLTGGPGPVTPTAVAFFAAAGLIGTVAGRLLRFVAIEQVGPSISAALIGLSPLFSAAFAIALLGEHVTLPIAAGTVVIVVGTVLLSAGGRTVGVRPGQLLLPLLSGLCFGIVAVLRKIGLGGAGPVAGAAINATTALVAYTAFLLAAGQPGLVKCRGRSLAHFVAAGVLENGAVFLTILALTLGAVSVVVPLTGTAPIFVLLLSPLFLRDVEVLNRRVVIGTVLVVLGVYLITAGPPGILGRP